MSAKVRSTPGETDAAVLAVLRTFFEGNRNQEWMPEQLVSSYCPATKPRDVKQALSRLTADGAVDQAVERPGNPYTRAYRLHDSSDTGSTAEPAVPR